MTKMKTRSFWGILLWICLFHLSGGQAAQCVMRGACEVDDVTYINKPCVYNGEPIPLNDTYSIGVLKDICPRLELDPDFATCCDVPQIATFQEQMGQMGSLFKRCPSCYYNLANIFCQLICNPNQTDFLIVTNSTVTPDKKSERTVNEMSYFITESYVDRAYTSCKNVQLAFSPTQKAIEVACGSYGKRCNPYHLMSSMGDHSPSPYQINFKYAMTDEIIVENRTYYPINNTITLCSEPAKDGGAPCSCVDCPCVPRPPPEPVSDDFQLFGISGMYVIMIITFAIITFTIVCGFVCAACNKRRNNDEDLLISDSDDFSNKLLHDNSMFWERWGNAIDDFLQRFFTKWGFFCASHPIIVLFLGLSVVAVCSCSLYSLSVETDTVNLWAAKNSRSREEKNYFDTHFGPFYRTEQVIITRKDGNPVVGTNFTYSDVFDREFLHQILDLQKNITSLTAEVNNRTVYFDEICFAPVKKRKCMVQSVVNWFQNKPEHLDYYKDVDDYLSFIRNCTTNPMFVQNEQTGLSCLGDYGGPIFPYVALGGVGDEDYAKASAIILTFMVTNHVQKEDNADALAWEKVFIEFMKRFTDSENQNSTYKNMTFAFSSERSIVDELGRESNADIKTILISYMVMFVYVSLALGQYHSIKTIFVKSKIVLGLSGVVIVIASVSSSLGVFTYFDIAATLICIEVIPFLVLAVGVDNIFIIVQTYQRTKRHELESREEHIGRVLGKIAPSLLLASISESMCFFLGALTQMPAVHTFALFAGLALFIDFILQITCFISLLSLDAAREERGRLDICCCIKTNEIEPPKEHTGFLYNLFNKYYAPFLMKDFVRCFVLVIFSGWVCSSVAVINKIDVGLDQKLSMPEDSYVLNYFKALEDYLSVGPPVYFVVKSGYEYSNFENQNLLGSVAYCKQESLVSQVSDASQFSNRTYIGHPPMAWIDNYLSWADDGDHCCRVYSNDSVTFCSDDILSDLCQPCGITDQNTLRPLPEDFYPYLPHFLKDSPNADCPVAGHSAFSSAVEMHNYTAGASHFMTYHTILKTSSEYTEALRVARQIADNVTHTFRVFNVSKFNDSLDDIEVFPYSIFYVFYEQYLTVSHDTLVSLSISVVNIFLTTLFLMGLDFHSALVVVLTILMILFDLMGLMYWWDISLNAVSLVNLVMAVGISVEFCSHILRSFAFARHGSRVERAQHAIAHMGSSVLSGITLTKFGGIIVLAFSKSQIFRVFYFRMYLGIVLIGAAHGLIFLPVFLSVVGPPVKQKNKGILEQQPIQTFSDTKNRSDDECLYTM